MEKTNWEILPNSVVSDSVNNPDARYQDDVAFLDKIKMSSRYYLENRHMDTLYRAHDAIKAGLGMMKKHKKLEMINDMETAISDYIPRGCFLGLEGRNPSGRFGVWKY